VGGRHGKYLEIDESCFTRRKGNCGRLCATAWVFIDVERELGTPVLHLSLITTIISEFCGYNICLLIEGLTHHAVDCSIFYFLWHDAHTNKIEATWKHINIYLRLY